MEPGKQTVQGGLSLRYATMSDLFEHMPEIAEDVDVRPNGEDMFSVIDGLLGSEIADEALTLCAYNLPPRHAVWWGHECLQRMTDLLTPHDEEMLALAATWVAAPEEEARQAALAATEAQETPTAGTWMAYAAAWSGGSMVGPELPEVAPEPHLTPKAVNAAVQTVLGEVDPQERDAVIASFVKMARQLAEGS